jgi:hypothetical protein
MGFGRRFRIFLNVLTVVTMLLAVKFVIHIFKAEYLELDTLFSSVVAGTIFVIGFLLSGMLPDYKDAERMSGDIRVALESIYDDVVSFAQTTEDIRVDDMRAIVLGVVDSLDKGLGDRRDHAHLGAAIDETDRLVPFIAELERKGMSANFVVRVRGAVDNLRKAIYRIYYIQKIEFLPSVHILIQTLSWAVIVLLMLLKTDGSIGSDLIFAFSTSLFVFALHVISVFEQPFRPGSHASDKVSFFLLHEFAAKLRTETPAAAQGTVLPQNLARSAARTTTLLADGAKTRRRDLRV